MAQEQTVKPGQRVYSADGTEIGVVGGLTDEGFVVRAGGDDSLEREPGGAFGKGYVVWRCADCGEMGGLDQLPESCPGCDAGREALYACLED